MEYKGSIRVGSTTLSKTLRVNFDPRIRITEAELTEQLKAGLEMRGVVMTLNRVVTSVDDLTNQLNAISERMPRGRWLRRPLTVMVRC